MTRYTIVREGPAQIVNGVSTPSGTVYVDQQAHPVDTSDLPSYFHALQWYGDRTPPYGEIEYAEDAQGKKMPNTRFSDFAPYQVYVDRWNAYAPPALDNPDAPAEDAPA